MKPWRLFLGLFLSTFVVLLVLLTCSSAAVPPRLECVLSADRATYGPGQTPRLHVRINNKSTREVYLIGSLDGSFAGRRFPKWRLEILDAAGKPVTIPQGGGGCGNMNSLRLEDFVSVPPGHAFDPFGAGFFGSNDLWMPVGQPGVYTVRFIYSTASPDIRDYYGDERGHRQYQPSSELMRRFKRVPKLELRSNELTVEFTAANAEQPPAE